MKSHRFQTLFLAVLAGMFLFCQQAEGQKKSFYGFVNAAYHGPVKRVLTTQNRQVPLQQEPSSLDVDSYYTEEIEKNGDIKSTSLRNATNLINRTTNQMNKKTGQYVNCKYDQSGVLIHTNTYLVNKKGQLTEIRRKEGSTEYTERMYEYDRRGNRIQMTSFNKDGSIAKISRTYYDKKNRVVADSTFYGGTRLISFTQNTYDKKGQVVYTKEGMNERSKLRVYEAWFNYLKDGKTVEAKMMLENQTFYGTQIKDKKKHIEEVIAESLDGKKRTITYRNEHGDEVKYEEYLNDVLVQQMFFDFDKYGNWIKKTFLDLSKKTKSVTTCDIEYYDE